MSAPWRGATFSHMLAWNRMPSEREARLDDPRARVLAVDDHVPFLALLHDLVGATHGLQMIGEATCGEQAVQMAQHLEPDLVLMDVRMPGLGGVGATRKIKVILPRALVVLISTTRPDELPPEVDDSGADAVVWKSNLRPQWLDELWRANHKGATR